MYFKDCHDHVKSERGSSIMMIKRRKSDIIVINMIVSVYSITKIKHIMRNQSTAYHDFHFIIILLFSSSSIIYILYYIYYSSQKQ